MRTLVPKRHGIYSRVLENFCVKKKSRGKKSEKEQGKLKLFVGGETPYIPVMVGGEEGGGYLSQAAAPGEG